MITSPPEQEKTFHHGKLNLRSKGMVELQS